MAFGNGPKIVTSGLVLCLDASDVNSYTSGSTSWLDLSNNGNTGTLTNGPTFSSGNGGSISFDGVDDKVTDTDTNFPSSGYSRTFSVWFKTPSSYPGINDTPMFVSYGTLNFNNAIFFGWDGRTNPPVILQYRLLISNYGNQAYNNTALSLNTIYNAVVTKPSGSETYSFYLNGIADGDNTWTGASNTSTSTTLNGVSYIGGDASTRYFKGNLYNILVYNRALTAQEVLQNFNAQRSKFGI